MPLQCLGQMPGWLHLLLVCKITVVKVGDDIVEESSSDDYDQVMSTKI